MVSFMMPSIKNFNFHIMYLSNIFSKDNYILFLSHVKHASRKIVFKSYLVEILIFKSDFRQLLSAITTLLTLIKMNINWRYIEYDYPSFLRSTFTDSKY